MGWRRVLILTGLLVAVLVTVGAIVVLSWDDRSSAPAPASSVRLTPRASDGPSPTPTQPGGTTTTTPFELEDGKVVYRAPSPMRVNDVQRVTVRVAGKDIPPDLTSGLPGTGPVTTDPAKVGTALTADLSGPDFQITRVGGDDGKRELREGGFAEWAWDVRPQKSGKLNLDFVLYVAKDAGGVPIDYRTYAHDVEVVVNFSYSFGKFVRDYGALTGLTVPVVAGAVWTFFRWLRKKRKPPVEEDAETP